MIKVVVIGSSSIDLVVQANSRPQAGETILGDSFATVPGGKGANQAVAAARLGAESIMLGKVGSDVYGEQVLANFAKEGVAVTHMESVTHLATGTAHITLAEGDNSIIVVPGANSAIDCAYIDAHKADIAAADIVLTQQEIPAETVAYLVDVCAELQVPLVLNPAPARAISLEMLDKVAYVTPNEHEAKLLFPELTADEIVAKYPNKMVITEGLNGVRFHNGSTVEVVPTYRVEAVDTTGAGDTFNAAFAVAIARGETIKQSLIYANRAASLSVTGFGAQGGMPTHKAVEAALHE